MRKERTPELILMAIVFGHLIISAVHGAAHSAAHVPMTFAANLFIAVIIFAGPLIGLATIRSRPVAGGWVVAAAMTGALVFGVVNHFVIDSADHVAQVAAPWRSLFATTAALLAVTETAGVCAGMWYAKRAIEPTA